MSHYFYHHHHHHHRHHCRSRFHKWMRACDIWPFELDLSHSAWRAFVFVLLGSLLWNTSYFLFFSILQTSVCNIIWKNLDLPILSFLSPILLEGQTETQVWPK
jgi:hypothetical protein